MEVRDTIEYFSATLSN